MATVYLAVQKSMGRKVALKVMKQALTADEDFGQSFLKESRTVAELNHRHIVIAHECGDVDGQYFLVTEYICGGDLKSRINNISPAESLVIIRQMTDQ